mmetsp:Transcript_24789/g.68611  ORF Transcript_24789/g.68611 Transcript_24789/m.68611 type:complete len:89 (-) Transcript_24789:2044-2310(-)
MARNGGRYDGGTPGGAQIHQSLSHHERRVGVCPRQGVGITTTSERKGTPFHVVVAKKKNKEWKKKHLPKNTHKYLSEPQQRSRAWILM